MRQIVFGSGLDQRGAPPRRALLVLLALLVVLLAAAATAGNAAAGTKIEKGSGGGARFRSGPVFADQGLTLAAAGEIGGIQARAVRVDLAATGIAQTVCVDETGQLSPGAQVEVDQTGSATLFPGEKVRTVPFGLATSPTPVTPASAGCPFAADAYATDVAYTGASLAVTQGGAVVLTQDVQL